MFKLKTNLYALALTFALACLSTQMIFCDKAEAFSNQEQYENNVTTGNGFDYIGSTGICLSPFKLLMPWTMVDFFLVNMPKDVSNWSNGPFSQPADFALATTMFTMAFINWNVNISPIIYTIASQNYFVLLASAPYLASFLFQAERFFTACTNAFIMQPHEYVNYTNGWVKSGSINGKVKNVHPCAVTRDDVPYLFQCDAPGQYGYSTELCSDKPILVNATTTCAAVSDKCVCNGVVSNPPSYLLAKPSDVGKVMIGFDGDWLVRMFAPRKAFKPTNVIILDPNDVSKRGFSGVTVPGGGGLAPTNALLFATLLPYSFLSSTPFTGLQACVSLVGVQPPITIGCSPISPPVETITPDPYLRAFLANTRCSYVYGPRSDLNALSNTLNSVDENGHVGTSVKRFLSSPLHITSTVVGCVKDIIYQVISQNSLFGGSLVSIQANMHKIVFAALTLYMALVGIKIMSSTDLKRGEFIMFLMKFVIVAYFTTPDAWYPTVTNPNSLGLLNGLIYAADEIGSYFTVAININDPIGMCQYQYNGANVLGNRVISLAPGIHTAGSSGVAVTMWDLLDCKLLNYLNLGTCNYTLGGLAVAWIISICLSFSFLAMIFAIMMLLYSTVVINLVFRLAHTFILSTIVIGVLVLISPICIACYLFPFTKGIFDEWLKKLLGYMLYPGLMTALLCMSVASIDAVYYGQLNSASVALNSNFSSPIYNSGTASEVEALSSLCTSINHSSLYCKTFKYTGDPCSTSKGNLASMFTSDHSYPIGIQYRSLNYSVITTYIKPMFLMMLIVWFFNIFMGTGLSIISHLTGVMGMDKMVKGFSVFQIASDTFSAGKSAAKGVMSIHSSAMNLTKGVQNLMKKRE